MGSEAIASGEAKKLRLELLMAARGGKWEKLNELLNSQDEDAPSSTLVVVHIDDTSTPATANARRPTGESAAVGPPADSILHVVASSGDGANFLKSATVIYAKDAQLLYALNSNGDTPLQCAARAGNIGMVSHLIHLATNTDVGGNARLKEMLKNQNGKRKTTDSSQPVPGDTALHDALRLGDKKILKKMVHMLLQYNVELTSIDSTDGTSPLYLAVMLGHYDIAETLYQNNKRLSYSGPDGQNVLHVAVLRSPDMTDKLLKWNIDLTKQRDRTTGSTPLHFAATWGKDYGRVIKLLLDKDESLAFQSDVNGSFPIHAAAVTMMSSSVVNIFLKKHPSCARLQDAKGRTFLHIAVEKECSFVVRYACWREKPAMTAVLNIQDNAGNTALHLAAKVCNQWSFYFLIQNPHVQLNLVNNRGLTPLDIAWKHRPQGIIYGLDPRVRIHLLLKGAGAKNGSYKWDWFVDKHVRSKVDQSKLDKMIRDSSQIIGVGSVLIVTVTMAAAITIPGGFRAAEDTYKGTAMLSDSIVFQLFIVANTLALVCSGLATMNVMFAGVATVDIRTRMSNFLLSILFVYCSSKALVASFLFGLYAVLPPTAVRIAYISSAIAAPFLVLDVLWFIFAVAFGEVMLLRRLGCITWLRNFSLARFPNFILEIKDVLEMPLPPKKTASEKQGSGSDN